MRVCYVTLGDAAGAFTVRVCKVPILFFFRKISIGRKICGMYRVRAGTLCGSILSGKNFKSLPQRIAAVPILFVGLRVYYKKANAHNHVYIGTRGGQPVDRDTLSHFL